MKFEIFCLKDLSIKGEGNLHIIILNERTDHVFRFPKSTSNSHVLENGDREKRQTDVNIYKMYKIGVNFKKYSVLQKFWGKVYLPKTRAGLMPAKIIEEIAAYVEDQRADSRRHRSIITSTAHIEIQPDLTVFCPEHREFTSGVTLCVELKPKFGILLRARGAAGTENCLHSAARFCLTQLQRAETDRTAYCPCDFFSGNHDRMRRAIKALIANSQDKLRLFQDGQIVGAVDEGTVTRLVSRLLHGGQGDGSDTGLVDRFCDLLVQAVTYDKSETGAPVVLPFKVSTACRAHPWGSSPPLADPPGFHGIPDGSVLGRLIHTDCLLDNSSQEMKVAYDTFKLFLTNHNIDLKENIFDLWDEHLITLEIPESIRTIIRQLKKYVVSLTIRDCSLMLKFSRASERHSGAEFNSKEDNSVMMRLPDGSLVFATIDIIDISIKPLSKIEYNVELEQRLRSIFD